MRKAGVKCYQCNQGKVLQFDTRDGKKTGNGKILGKLVRCATPPYFVIAVEARDFSRSICFM